MPERIKRVRGVEKYHLKGILQGRDPAKQAEITRKYRSGSEALQEFDAYVKTLADGKLRLPPCQRRQLFNFGRHIYGQARKAPRDQLVDAVIPSAFKLVCNGFERKDVIAMAEWSFEAAAGGLTSMELEKLTKMLDKAPDKPRVVQIEEGGDMTEGSQNAKGKLQNAEGETQETEHVTEASQKAEAKSQESKAKAQGAGGKEQKAESGNCMVGTKPPDDMNVPVSQLNQKTALERFTRHRAIAMLREALAVHQPVVKQCVVERLSHHKSYDELAKQFFLTREEVTDIMTRMRKWVRRYTTYFENDWYWVDDGQPRKIMQG